MALNAHLRLKGRTTGDIRGSVTQKGREGRIAVIVVLIGLGVLMPGATRADAQMFVTTGRDTLRGLPGVEVLVEQLQAELERGGFTSSGIKADVERQLRTAGIRVYATQAENPSPAKAYLYVNINAMALPRGAGYAVAVQLHLRQTLRSLVTSSNVVNAMTWYAQNLVSAPGTSLQNVRGELQIYVGQFVQDWTAVH